MQLSIILCALVAVTVYAAPSPGSNNQLSRNNYNNVAENSDNLSVMRLKKATAKEAWEENGATQANDRAKEFRNFISLFEKFVSSDRITKAKNMSDILSEVVNLLMRVMKLLEDRITNDSSQDSER